MTTSPSNRLEIETPECDKWAKVHEDAVVIEAFLDFLSSRGITLAEAYPNYDQLCPIRESRQDLIYDHFGINSYKLEKERQELLTTCQNKLKELFK